MTHEGLIDAYSLTPIQVSPKELLLDPTNPRLITETGQYRDYSIGEICDAATQEHILELVCRKEHGVKQLISSIAEMGFMGGHNDMLVKELGRGRYLVLEGNRRTAALQHLIQHGGKLRADVHRSIQQIEVKKFTYKKNPRYGEKQVIDVLLGSIHIGGPKEWGALEKAHYVLRAYAREFAGRRAFRYDLSTARRVGSDFQMSPKLVHKYLIVCRVYEQLREAGLPVLPHHYTLIELATRTRAVSESYFEVDEEECRVSSKGSERFAELCLGAKPPIHNPKLFKAFVGIYTEGTDNELAQVLEGEDAEEVWHNIRQRKKRREFLEDLTFVREQLSELEVAGFRGTEGERDEIRRIKELVDDLLLPLARRRTG